MNEQDTLEILTEVQGTHGTGITYLMNDGFLYLSYQVTENARYFRCKKYRNGCPVRVIFYANGSSVLEGLHDHPDAQPELMYRNNRLHIINQVHVCTVATFQDIFNDPRNELLTANPLLSYHRLLPSVIRAQRSRLPPCETLAQLNAVLSSPAYSCLTRIDDLQDSLYRGSAHCNDGSSVILLMSRRCCEFLRIIPSVVFLRVPVLLANLHQLEICLVGAICDNIVIPLAWILAENYSQEALLAGFTLLKSSLIHYAFSQAMCTADFAALTFAHIFSVEVYPSLYDFINDIASQVRVSVNRNNINKVAQLCCILPLLPMDRLQLGIDFVKRHAMQFGESTYNEAERLLFHFIEEEWLKIPQKKFFVSENIDRTNYGCEHLKNQINSKFSSCNSDFYSVIRYIVSQLKKSDTETEPLLLGHRIRRQVPVPLLQQQDVVTLFRDVIRPSFSAEMSVQNLLVAVSEKITHLIVT